MQERVLADRKYKEKEQRGRFGEIDEKISREEYILDWSQSKVFLVSKCDLKQWSRGLFRGGRPNKNKKAKKVKSRVAVNGTPSHSYGVSLTIIMGPHSVTFHPTQVNTPRLNASQTGRNSIYRPRRDGRLS